MFRKFINNGKNGNGGDTSGKKPSKLRHYFEKVLFLGGTTSYEYRLHIKKQDENIKAYKEKFDEWKKSCEI